MSAPARAAPPPPPPADDETGASASKCPCDPKGCLCLGPQTSRRGSWADQADERLLAAAKSDNESMLEDALSDLEDINYTDGSVFPLYCFNSADESLQNGQHR